MISVFSKDTVLTPVRVPAQLSMMSFPFTLLAINIRYYADQLIYKDISKPFPAINHCNNKGEKYNG